MSSCISSVIIAPQVQRGGLALTQYLIFLPSPAVNERLFRWLHLTHAIPEIKVFWGTDRKPLIATRYLHHVVFKLGL